MTRYEIQIQEGPPHGGLYELEQTTYFHVVDVDTQVVVLTLRGDMEASLSPDSGPWDNYRFSGMQDITLAPDRQSVLVHYHDGHEEIVPLPG